MKTKFSFRPATFLVAAISLLLFGASAFSQTILRVNQAATGNVHNGSSWPNAFLTLQDALAAAQPTASQMVEIWIATGTYKPTSGTDRNAAFQLKSHLIIRGGFRGDETTTSARTPWGNPVVLSGDIGTPMVGQITALNQYPTQRASTSDAGWNDNCYNVLVGNGVTDVMLEFLTITGGSATNASIGQADIDGYEIYSDDPSTAGANSAVKPSSTVVGGGLCFSTGPTWNIANYGLQMYNCTFTRNRARGYGGAVTLYDGSAFIGGCSFDQNVSDGPGGAIWGLNQASAYVQSTFTGNSAGDGGGAVKIMGIPSPRSSNADVDKFNDTLRTVAFAIFGVNEEQTRDSIGYVLTSYGIYKAGNKFAAAQGGFFSKAAATIPNPFAKSPTTVTKPTGGTFNSLDISPGARIAAAYAIVQIGVSAAGFIVDALDYFGKLDKNSADYQRWKLFNDKFNQYATPQGLISLAAHSAIDALLPGVQPDLISAKKKTLAAFTQAGRSAFASCIFTGNTAGNEGGAIELIFNNLLVEDCNFKQNSAWSNGGAISSAVSNSPQIVSSVFSNNSCNGGASAIGVSFSSLMMVINCTIVNNQSSDALGKAVTAAMGADVRIYNSILWNNRNGAGASGADVEAVTESMLNEDALKRYNALQGDRVNWLGYMDIRNSIVQSLASLPLGTDKIAPQLAGANLSTSEINAAIALTKDADSRGELESTGAVNVGAGIRQKVRDPAYGNSAADPMLLTTPQGKTSVQSPANNAGNNQWINWKMLPHAVDIANIMDVAGKKRILNSRVDIGAYEVDNTQPDSAALASANVTTGSSSTPGSSGVGASSISIPTVSPTTPPGVPIYYVKPVASGNGSGSSWANATSDLQGAMSHSSSEVWVAAGTYKPTSNTDRTISFSMASAVKVFGGFSGNGTETTRSARNWKTNVTIISGDIGSPNDASDNSKNLFKNAGLTGSAVLDGFTLQDANSSDVDGGAICNSSAAPLIQNCIFRNNHARNGGAIFSSGTDNNSSILVSCEFRNNSAELEGGAVRYTQTFLGDSLIFSGNTADAGGAISVTGSVSGEYCTVQNGLFYSNSATSGTGGAIASSGLFLNVVNSTFYGNTATISSSQKVGGGAIDDGFAPSSPVASPIILNSIFYKNTTSNPGGGGLQTVEKQQIQAAGFPLLKDCLVQGVSTYAVGLDNGDFSGDPQFVAEGTDFHLRDTSLAIDAGDSTNIYTQTMTVDLDGGSRVINGAMDLGPYEHSATAAHPAKSVSETSNGTESFTFTAAYTPAAGDTLRWYVDRGDGLGFVPLTESDENKGVFSSTLTVSSRPNGFTYRLQVVHGGVTYISPATTLQPTAESIFRYVYVKPVATGDGTGSSWANATSDLQGAIARDGAEVWVAAGTYKPTSGTDRNISFSMGASTKVYGGFLGTETKLDARDWRANKTIISGEIGDAGVEDNSRHLFHNTNVLNIAILDGFYLQDAYADGVDGGAVLNVSSAPAIQNCVFQSNHARNGGAICSTGTLAIGFGSKLFNCEFRGNSADLGGGAVNSDGSWSGSSLLFKDNTAQTGGAIYSTGDSSGRSCTVQNALFTGNLATAGPGGAAWVSGSSLTLINSTLYANQATVNSASPAAGGAVYLDQGTSNIATLTIYNSILYKNTALNQGSGGIASVEKQQISLSGGSQGGAKCSLIQGLQAYVGNGNFDGDPLFVHEGTDFHVMNTSLTIGAGTMDDISSRLETTDLDGNDRIIDAIDLGPYEHAATPSNPIRKITAASSGLESYSYTAADYVAQTGDTLQWQVDRGDGSGFVTLSAHDPGDDSLPDEYLGVTTASLTVLSPPSGFLFRLKLVQGNVTYYSPVSRLSPTDMSKRTYVYVRPVATGDGSGSGWTNATGDLQAAISRANVQVWVQAGSYYPTTGTDRDASFSLTGSAVQVYGGFKGTESLRAAREPSVNVTRISGNIGSASSALDNSRHLFRNQNIGASTTLDGLTFEDAYADGEDGGAILNTSASPTIQNCVFRNNYARNGGAIASTGTPDDLFGSDLVGCRFENNTAELTGGAISYSSSLSMENVVFEGNKAGAGGAINLDGNSAGESFTIKNGLFLDNRALAGQGGAIFSKGLYLNVQNSTFYGNQATLSSASPLGGGAIYQDYVLSGTSTVTIYNSIFYENACVNSGTGGLESLEYQQIAIRGDNYGYASHSLIQGLNHYENIAALGNFDEDPQFVDPTNGDFHLSSVSPGINSGTDSEGGLYLLTDTDLDDKARVVDTVDLGPYEYAGSAALGRVISSSDFSSGTLRFFKTTTFAVQAGDVLQWYVDRGDGHGFVALSADGVYSGVDSATLSITSPPSSANGYIFRLQVVRAGTTLTTLPTQLKLPPSRIYVDAARLNMSADGESWFTAYGSLSDALKASGPGTTIWVAGGTYLPTSGTNTNAAFQIPAGVTIYGGFPSSAHSLTQRNTTLQPSILSGKLNGAGSRLDYSSHVVMNQGTSVTRTATLDGFVLEDSYSSLLVNDGASPTIRNCIFRNNDSSRAGDGYGAAISNINGANPLIAECQFLGNTAAYAGALYFSGASATIENSIFAGNSATACGGAIFVRNGNLSLIHCTVADNTSQGTAAALYTQDSTVTVGNSIFWNNRTSYAGWSIYDRAIQTAGGTLTFDYSCVEGGTSLPSTNLTYNPIFDPTQGGDYALALYSPLVNAGSASYTVSSSKDLVGQPRIHESAPDMGAYELQTNATAAVRLNSMPRSTVTYNIGGSVDFTLSWPAGTTVDPTWFVYQGTTALDPSRYTIIEGNGFSTVRINDLSLSDTGLKVSFTDSGHGIFVTAPAVLTVKEPRIVRVNPAASGNNDGTSWTDAYTDLTTALDNAQTADEIWVVGGTYTPGSDSSFNLSRTVTLLGGFLGTETTRTDRDPVNHPTTLHAVGSSPILYAATPDSDSGVTSAVDGFIIENSTGPATIYNAGVSTTYRNCVFRNNAGYIGNFQSQVQYDHCEFTGNTGNMFIADQSTVTLGDSTIHDNTTTVDLMSSSNNSTVVFTDTVVSNNTVAGALFRNSSGSQGGSLLTVLRSSFRGNTTGGAIIANGSGASCAIESSLLVRNSASGDLATVQNDGTISINFSTIADNRGGSFGGGLATYVGSTASINSSIFWGNRGTRASSTLLAQQTGDSAGTDGSGALTITRSIIEGITTSLSAYNPQTNMGFYPLFADPITGDYHLPANSPAASTAPSNFPLLSATDLDKVTRRNVNGAAGAYESPAQLGTPLLISSYPSSVATTETTATGFTYVGQGTKQWQYFDGTQWVNITTDTSDYQIVRSDDGNTSTLHFNSPSQSLDGSRYRLVITFLGITYTSNDLILTVNQPRVLYVNGGVAASGNGSSWATAFKTIQEALAVTNENTDIWVQAGTYAINTANLSWKVHLYGGFAGNETQRSQRDWAANEVTLVGGGKQIFTSSDSTATRNTKTSDAVLDGFTLTGSTTQTAVFLDNSESAIRNCTFRGNGSAIGVSGQSSPIISNCVFDSQLSTVLSLSGDSETITGCTFKNNSDVISANSGAQVYILRGNVTISDSTFTGNKASGGTVFAYGDFDATSAANVAAGKVTKLTMSRCQITNNTAYAAIFVQQALVNLDNSLIAQNTVTSSAIRGFSQCQFNLTNVTIADNTGTFECAGIQSDGRWNLSNSIVWGNRTSWPYGPLLHPNDPTLVVEDMQIELGSFTAINNSIIEGGYYSGHSNGNSTYDPLFVDPGALNYQLTAISPGINAGSAAGIAAGTLDLASQPRLADTPDMGAYEFQGTPGTPVRMSSNLGAKEIVVGQGTQYSVQVPAGVSVQWQVKSGASFVNVVPDGNQALSGDGSVLTLSKVPLTLDGNQYRFVLSGGASYTSAAATLTVVPKPIVYVDVNATGNRDGTSWANAFTSPNDAINGASDPITGGPREVWVAQGTYVTGQYPVPPGVELYGGFAGGEIARSDRNISTHPTILTSAAGIDTRSYLLSDGYPDSAKIGIVIDGFTLTGASSGVNVQMGPGFVRNCTFANLAGNGVNAVYVPLTVEDSVFTQPGLNAVVASPGSTTTIRRSIFQGGMVVSGTDLYPANASIEDSIFQNNAAGEATIKVSANSTLDMTRCRVLKNQSTYAIENDGTLRVRQSLIADNAGDGVYATYRSAATLLTSVTVAGNGVIGVESYESSRSVVLTNCIVAGNDELQIYTNSQNYVAGISVNHSLTQGQVINGDSTNMTWDPLFVNPSMGDYTLAARSPGINAGDATAVNSGETDLTGAARIQSGGTDLGAYESAASANPLYRGTLPTSLSTTRGVDGVFSLVGASSYTYTWEYSSDHGATWATISFNSATGLWEGPGGIPINITTVNGVTTLTVPSPGLIASGTQFRVSINGEGVTSNPFTLTVNEPEIMYVDASVATSGDGKTWATAFKDLSTAVGQVNQSRRIIYVAKGTYKPSAAGYTIRQRMEVYGGFPTGGAAFAARDTAANPVILSGELGDPASTDDNAYPVVSISALNAAIGADTVFDGLTVDSGKIGVSVMSNANPTLRNLIVSNSAMNGLTVDSSGGRVENCQFVGNLGGGASAVSSTVTFSGCSFRGNTAATGGAGLLIFNGSVRMENLIISGNKAVNSGGGIEVDGGSHVLVNSTVVGNYAGDGGGLYVYIGANLTVRNSIFWGNRAASGTLDLQQADHHLFGGSFSFQSSDIEGRTPDASNLSVAPLFYSTIDAASAPTTTGDFHLYGGSPGVDGGDNTLLDGLAIDADKAPRTVRTVDMGAYEFQGSASDPLIITQQPADLVLPVQNGASQFQVALSGSNYTFQWESSPNGSTFTPVVDGVDFAGAQTATLQVLTSNPTLQGLVFRAKITSPGGGTITSRSALLTVYPAVYYVNSAAADDTGDGYTWGTAFKTLGTALAKVRVNPVTGVQVWVAGGTYRPSETDTTFSFPIKSKVELYGGFTGTETALTQRDYVAHPTILQGIVGSAAVFLSTGTNAIPGVRIDGFAINTATNGISMDKNVTLTVANCSFSGLATGVAGNTDTVTVQNCQFTGMSTAGTANHFGTTNVADSVFSGNALGVSQGSGSVNIVRSAFRGNGTPAANGGGVRINSLNATLDSCLFSGNYSQAGSGLYATDGHIYVQNCTFAGNYATFAAGLYYVAGSSTNGVGSIQITNSILWGNNISGTQVQYSQYYYDNPYTSVRPFYNNDIQRLPGSYTDFDFTSGNGNISVEPNFVAPVTASATATAAGDYRLSSISSNVINKGSNTYLGTSTTDLAQAPRTFDTTVDLGAYEFQAVLVAVTTQPTSVTAGIGRETAVFTAGSNSSDATYQWQVSTDSGLSWTDLTESAAESGVTTATLTVSGGAGYDGRLYRAKVTSPDTSVHPGVAYSNAAQYRYATVAVTPPDGVRNATLTGASSTISFSVAGGALPASIVDGNFAVHAMQTGRLSLADGSLTNLSISGETVSMQSAVPFKAGEVVEVTSTSAVQRTDGFYTKPLVYQFHAGNRGSYGAFLSGTPIAGAPATARALASGDLNGDGFVDLVVGGTNGATVWLNNGTGTFTAASQTLGSGAVDQVLLGSLGMTGSTGSHSKLDIVLRKSTGDIEIWRNEGNGTFTNTSLLTGVAATALGLADLNGDGALDLFIATAGADQVWFNDGAGIFSDSGQRLGTGAGLSIAFGDYNKDNYLDVFTANGSGNMEIWNNDGTGHFTAATTTPSGSAVNRVIAVDLDKDDRLDLVTVRSNGQIRIFRQASDGAFNFTTNTPPVGVSVSDATALSVGDVDGDGTPDLVFSNSSNAIQVWRGQGYDSSFDRMNFLQVPEQPALSIGKAEELADFNGDGMMDAVFISPSGVPTVALYVGTPTAPTSLTATRTSDTQIALAWTDNATNETAYTVERSANGTSGWTVITSSLPANSISYTDTGRSPSTPYFYRVRCNVGGVLSSAYSNTASATTAGAISAAPESIAVQENATATTLVGGASSVLSNDGNPDGGTLQATVVTDAIHGALTLNADGTFSYTPAAGFSGSDSFTYRATNSVTGAASTATVAITVTRLNEAPDSLTFSPVAGTRYTGQPAGLAVATLSATDPDPEDAGQLTFSLVSGSGSADNADFAIVGNALKTSTVIDASAGLIRSIRIRVTDSMGASREQSFMVTFVQAPTAAAAAFSLDEDTPLELLLSGTGGAGSLAYEILSQPSHGTLTLSTTVSGANAYLYTPDANYYGPDSFTYRVGDSTLNSTPVTVTFTVASVDDAPTLDAIAPVTTIVNTPTSFTLVGHDADGDAITSYQLVSTPTLGTVQMNGATVTYTPNANVLGTETLTFTVTAGALTSAPLPVVVNITPVPVALTVYRGLYEYSDIPAASSGDWSGVLPENISTPAHGVVTLEGSRLLYKHNGDSATSDTFTYTLTNGAGDIRQVAVLITISNRVIDVTSSSDSGPGSLRAAIDTTNRFSADTLAPEYTAKPDWLVRILPATGTFGILSSATNLGTSLGYYSYFQIAGNVTVDATANPGYILTTGGSHRARQFLVMAGASLTLKQLYLNNGEASDRNFLDPNPMAYGGAVLNFGTFTAENVTFRFARSGQGAAIYNNGGNVSLTNCVFDQNFAIGASDPGGIVASRNGSVALDGVTFTGNTGQSGGDLSILGDGALATVTVSNSTITSFRLATANGGTLSVTGLPYARPDTVTRPADQPVTIALATLLTNDSGGPFTSVTADTVSAQGVSITRDGDNLTYAAPAGLTTPDTFSYTVTAASGLTSTATVTVSIQSDPYPHGNADSSIVYRGLYEDIDVLGNDSDDNHGTLVVTAVSTPTHGTATIENGHIHYVNDDSSATTDTFTYSVSNGTNVTQDIPVALTIADRVLDATSGGDSGTGTLRDALGIVNRFTGTNTPQWTIRILAGSDATWKAASATNDGYPYYGSIFQIAGNVVIDASGSPNFTLSGPDDAVIGRLFLVRSGASLALKNLTLANGQAIGDQSNPETVTYGGAVYNNGTFSATSVDFRNNTAVQGAALYNEGGTVTLANCTFFDNVAGFSPNGFDGRGIVASVNGTLNLNGGVSINNDGSVAALFVQGGTLNHTGENHIASYQSLGSVTIVPGTPTAADDSVNCTQGKVLRIRLSTLFANDTNQANATVTFAGVSTNGVPITQSGDFLIYHTPGGQTGDDAFTYTLTDAIGIASTATVNVIKVDPLPVVTVAPRAGGGVVLTLKGQPVTTYRIHKSSDLVNWSVIQIEEPSEWNGFSGTEITTDGDGNATYEDTTSPDAGTASFYRAERY